MHAFWIRVLFFFLSTDLILLNSSIYLKTFIYIIYLRIDSLSCRVRSQRLSAGPLRSLSCLHTLPHHRHKADGWSEIRNSQVISDPEHLCCCAAVCGQSESCWPYGDSQHLQEPLTSDLRPQWRGPRSHQGLIWLCRDNVWPLRSYRNHFISYISRASNFWWKVNPNVYKRQNKCLFLMLERIKYK